MEVVYDSISLAVRPWVLSENYSQARSELLELIKERIPQIIAVCVFSVWVKALGNNQQPFWS